MIFCVGGARAFSPGISFGFRQGFNEDWQKAFSDNEIDGEALKLLKDPSVSASGSVSLGRACMCTLHARIFGCGMARRDIAE